MPKRLDKTGFKFGLLTIVNREDGHKRTHWKCVCDCGKTTLVSNSNLTAGNTKSCGCLWDRAVKKQMIGTRFGLLTVNSQVSSKAYGKAKFAIYKCLCDCGGEIETYATSLRCGDVISCGCAYKAAGLRRAVTDDRRRSSYQFRNKRRRASRLHAFSPYDREFFDLLEVEAYSLCKLRKFATGIAFEVDHIIPLQSKIVCGLHNEANLSVIPAIENNRKGNRYWPDMPDKKGMLCFK